MNLREVDVFLEIGAVLSVVVILGEVRVPGSSDTETAP